MIWVQIQAVGGSPVCVSLDHQISRKGMAIPGSWGVGDPLRRSYGHIRGIKELNAAQGESICRV